jgi:hypothetical protein
LASELLAGRIEEGATVVVDIDPAHTEELTLKNA